MSLSGVVVNQKNSTYLKRRRESQWDKIIQQLSDNQGNSIINLAISIPMDKVQMDNLDIMIKTNKKNPNLLNILLKKILK